MLTVYTMREFHQLAGRLRALQHRVAEEEGAGALELRNTLDAANVAFSAAVWQADELAKVQSRR